MLTLRSGIKWNLEFLDFFSCKACVSYWVPFNFNACCAACYLRANFFIKENQILLTCHYGVLSRNGAEEDIFWFSLKGIHYNNWRIWS